MRFRTPASCIFFFLLIAPLAAAAQSLPPHAPHRVIFKVRANTSLHADLRRGFQQADKRVLQTTALAKSGGRADAFLHAHAIQSLEAATLSVSSGDRIGMDRIFYANLDSTKELTAVLQQMQADPDIEYAEPDYIGYGAGRPVEAPLQPLAPFGPDLFPNDSLFALQWGFFNFGQLIGGHIGTPGMDINIVPAWDITTGDTAQIVAVLDSGIPQGASEFAGRILPGYDYANKDADPTDDHGHGTNVASILAATGNNGRLLAGVNWKCKILPFKILNSNNFGYYSWWISALTELGNRGIRVANMSVGGTTYSKPLQDGVTYAASRGTILVVSMMNDNKDTPSYPAAFPNVIAVGAINSRGERAVPFCWGGGSNYGDHIDFVAPGDWIAGLKYDNPNRISYWCGTSQAAPMVTGIVSLLLARQPNLTFAQVYDLLKFGARDQIGPANEDTQGWDRYFGWGLVDAAATLGNVVKVKEPPLPLDFTLLQNHPNPFNPRTVIRYRLEHAGHVRLEIFNLLGQRVARLVDERQVAGEHRVVWEARSASGGFSLPAGPYFYELRFNGRRARRRMILLR